MPADRRRRPEAKHLVRAATAVSVGVAAAVGVVAASPTVRAEAHRLRGFLRPLDSGGRAPLPPPLPPGRTVTVAERGEVFVRDTGAGDPAVLLLHGWGATADLNFFTAYPPLDGYRLVALDHRNHGRGLRTDMPFRIEDCADDAAGLLATLGIDSALVVGYSMGGSPLRRFGAYTIPDFDRSVAGPAAPGGCCRIGPGGHGTGVQQRRP